MSKFKRVQNGTDKEGNPTYHIHYWCLGCGYEHAFGEKIHDFNGDFENPTVSPSLLHTGQHTCHSFIKDGKIQYLSDCHHHLAGQTIELPNIDEMINKRKDGINKQDK